jgi:hypothetical protein
MCERSAGKCDGQRTLAELARLAQQLRQHPIPYQVPAEAEPRVLDETALAGIVYNAGMDLGQFPRSCGPRWPATPPRWSPPRRRCCR